MQAVTEGNGPSAARSCPSLPAVTEDASGADRRIDGFVAGSEKKW
ncbi:hypothetical protein [Azospirillum endophyticum]